ncbi:MAG: radical SAM/SPASM domain-containing protein [Alcanivoracaceae bacterium]|jgi:radical SAM protein with 4Fe4S-binding SPASM domain|nr:radical SAM/SPASM domain-containing protein [Alcanivoracaceae bacterium]
MEIRFAQIEPTTRCNYTCGFCVGRHMPQQDIALDTFRSFIDQTEGLEALELQGEGEPLLHPQFFDMVALARQKFPQLEISMISNGSMFTPENIERILDHGIARIFVSLESAKDEDFQRIRGGKLDRVRRGIRHLIAARNERGLQTPLIGLSVTVLRSTAVELEAGIPALYRELSLDGGINIQPLQTMPQYKAIYDDSMKAEIVDREASDTIQHALSSSEPLRAALNDRQKKSHIGFYERLYGSVDMRFQCPWLINGAYLATDGNVIPCCHIKDYERHALGNISDGIEPASTQRKSMQADLNRGRIPDACSGCMIAENIARNSLKLRNILQKKGQ